MTVADPYTTRASVVKRLPPGGLPSAIGLVASALANTDALTYDGHGFETDDPLTVRAVENGSLPSPLSEGTVYYAIRITNAVFKLATSPGGSAINLTTDGAEVVVMRDPDFDYWIGFYSRWADSSLPGHLVPMGRATPVPAVVEGIVADLVAKRMFNVSGQQSETIKDAEIAAKAQLDRFAAGLPVRDANATASANKSVASTVATAGDPRGWGSGYLP